MIHAFLEAYYYNLKLNKLKKFIDVNIDKIFIENFHDYLEIIDILEAERQVDRGNITNEFYYRGVSDYRWGLEPSIMFNNLEWCEKKMINEFKQLWPGEFNGLDMFNTIAKMQHFGLPTRLLDFSTNPLVALYFACSNNNNVDGKVFIALPRKKEHLKEYVDVMFNPLEKKRTLNGDLSFLYTYLQIMYGMNNLYFKRPDHLAEREKRQASIFMLFGNNIFNDETNRVLSNIEGANLYLSDGDDGKLPERLTIDDSLKKMNRKDFERNFLEIIIPAKTKKKILNKLSEIGIKKSFLFPEIEYTAEDLKEKYLNISQSFDENKFSEEYEY